MPTRAPRACTAPGCPHLVTSGRCPQHNPERARPSSHAQGYDRTWRKISKRYRQQHPTCEAPDCDAPSEHVDHIDGDNTNHEPWNLQALCLPCHSRKTALHDGAFGNPRTR